MKRNILICFFLFLFLNEKCKAQWTEIFNDTNYFWISDVKFLNNDTGYACGSWENNPFPGIILKTTNGGVTWDSTWVNYWPMSMSIVNDTLIYCGGEDGFYSKTNDAGNSWNREGSIAGVEDVSSIYFFNQDTGLAILFGGGIFNTTDGVHWGDSVQYPGNSFFPNNSSIQFLNDTDGFIAMKKTYKTSNAGGTWQELYIDSNRYFTSLYMKNHNEGIAVDDSGHFSLTSDGGLTWTIPQYLGPYPFYDVAFVTDSIGYIIGGNDDFHYLPSTNEIGVIYVTGDGGNTWSLMQTFDHALTSLFFVNDSVGYAVGHRGKILKITNANRVGISEVEMQNDFSISPNPTSFTFTITTTAQLQNAQLEIYNVVGEKVSSQQFAIGSQKQVTIDVSKLPSSIYFVKVKSEKWSAMRKLVVE